MARHLSFRSGNPALNKNSFKNLSVDRSKGPILRNELMTIKGLSLIHISEPTRRS